MKIKDLIFDITSPDGLLKAESGQARFYLGVDPTADSLHIGHLAAIVFAKRLIEKGNQAILLIGGATAQIGDPSGKKSERELLSFEEIKTNADKLTQQIKKYFNSDVEVVNNHDWLSKMTLPEFLRDYGKLFNIASMVKKDIVAARLETGISFTEFTYQVLQAIDFKYLAQNNDCDFQIGGQDQWGNITAGLELIRKTQTKKEAFGITLPLITKSDGTKFGKTEGGAIWLDAAKTSPYQMYQFFKNTSDDQVINLVKRLTLVSQDKLDELISQQKSDSKARIAQSYLADSVVEFVHSPNDLKRAKEITEILFLGDVSQLSSDELISCLANVPTTTLEEKEVDIQDFLVTTQAAKSRREAREFIISGSIMLNGKTISDDSIMINKSNAIDNKLHIIKRGKRKFFIGKY